MRGMTEMTSFCFLFLCFLGCCTAGNLYPEFDDVFTTFLRDHGYVGGAVAAIKNGRLLVARGYGHDRAGNEVSAYSKFPVSNLAKSLTAVAVLNLVRDGALDLEDKVFGQAGILSYIQPWKADDVDRRLYDVTVDQLLRHSAGWDYKQAPLYDPLFNRIHRQRGHKVPDIAKELGKVSPFETIDPEELISYVISFPLTFTPGTKAVYSNVGYLVLGRVIEALTGMEYRDYVKRLILDRCGMWNTRLERAHYVEDVLEADDLDPLLLHSRDPVTVDSTLGWYSNVYDMMRFSRCLFDTKALLDDKHLELLAAGQAPEHAKEGENWFGAGFRISSKMDVWQDGDLHTDDLILYHHDPFRRQEPSRETKVDVVVGKSEGGKTHHASHRRSDLPDSWVIFLCDKNVKHLRHHSKEVMAALRPSTRVGDAQNIFLFDLSEMHRHPSWEPPKSLMMPQFTLRFKVDEHHLTAYVNALRAEGFALNSFTSHTHKQHTLFLVMGRKDATPSKSDSDFVFRHGLDHRQLLKTKLRMEENRYNMTLLHSYRSKSHAHQYAFAALFNYEAFTSGVQMKYGTSHLPEPYEKLVQMYHEQEFYPLSQTVVHHAKDERFSFIFVRRTGGPKVDFRQFYNLPDKRLARLTAENAKKSLRLSYLNSYHVGGKFRFSAVFTNATHHRGLLEIEQPLHRATEITILNLKDGLAPKQVVPYYNDHGQLRIAAYYEEA